jgi:hypothetical protein
MVPRPPRCNGRSLTQRGFRLFPFRSPLLGESRLISVPPGTEMFQFPGFAPSRLCIQRAVAGFSGAGFPIRISPGQSLCSGSPTLFAATYVLLRLLVPRHPPCALSSLASSFPMTPAALASHMPSQTHAPRAMHCMLRLALTQLVKERGLPRTRRVEDDFDPKGGALPAELIPRYTRSYPDLTLIRRAL